MVVLGRVSLRVSCLKIEPKEGELSGLLYTHSWITQPDD